MKINRQINNRLLSLALLCVGLFSTQASYSIGSFSSNAVWPLCGRITENPPTNWSDADGCPANRWGNPNYTDAPLSSTYGPRQLASENFRYDFHRGLDIATAIGTPLFALTDGVVRKSGVSSGYSDPLIQLRHYRPGYSSCSSGKGCYHSNYLHISESVVNVGDTVIQGQLIGYTGASQSGFEHIHFEVRNAPAQDVYSNWNKDAIHPLLILPYLDTSANNIDLHILSVDASDPLQPIVEVQINIPFNVELDLEGIEIEAFERQVDDSFVLINQPSNIRVGNTVEGTGYWKNPTFYHMHDFNRQYSYKNSRRIPWSSFLANGSYESPYETELPTTYNANVHMDAADPNDPQTGLFNGWSITPSHTNANSSDYTLIVKNNTLVGTDNADNLCLKIRAVDIHGSVSHWQTWNCEQ